MKIKIKKPNKVYIYYHKDFDGILSAFLVSLIAKDRGFKPVIAKPVDYPVSEKMRFKEPFALVDFAYNENALFYFDHHSGNKVEKFSDRTKYSKFDDKAMSCASILYNELPIGCKSKKIEEMVKWCDIIDRAAFPQNNISVKQVLYSKKPAFVINRAFEEGGNKITDKFYNFLVESLVEGNNLDDLAKNKIILEAHNKYMKNQEQAIKDLKENSYYIKEKGIFVYDVAYKEWSRFAPFYLYPKSNIAIGIRTKACAKLGIGMSQNPWNKKANEALKNVHIGDILKKRYGKNGGGHKYVGFAWFGNHKAAKEGMKEIVGELKLYIIK